MPPTLALALMVCSAALHAAWNAALRRHPDSPAAGLLFVLGACLLTAIAAAVDAALILHGAGELRLALFWGLATGTSEGLYIFALSRALSIGPLAAVYAVSRGAPLLLLWPLSHALLGEPVGLRAVVAVSVLLLGVVVLAPWRSGGHTTTRAGYLWALVTASFVTSNSLMYKAAIDAGAPVLPLFAVALVIAFPIAAASLAPWRRGFLHAVSRRLRAAAHAYAGHVALGALGFAGSFLLALFTLRFQGAAWVLTLRNMSIAFAPLIAWAWLRERPSGRALAGIALVFVGALVLGWQ